MGQNQRLVRFLKGTTPISKRMQVVEHPSYYSLREEKFYSNCKKRIKKSGKKTAGLVLKKSTLKLVCVVDGHAPLLPASSNFFCHGQDEVIMR